MTKKTLLEERKREQIEVKTEKRLRDKLWMRLSKENDAEMMGGKRGR